MDATVLERPVVGFVHEEPQQSARAEHRAANRSPDTWEPSGKNVVRQYHGHSLSVEPLMLDGRCVGWFKWLDRHYRGMERAVENAEHALEQEADSVCSAWARQKAWESGGAPERRRAR